jgi:nucleotide-binding universal stress UspA family protein
MKRFHNILHVGQGAGDNTQSLKQALSLARNNGAALTLLLVHPEFPKDFDDYRDEHEKFLVEQAHQQIAAIKAELGLGDDLAATIQVVSGKNPATQIIRHVLRNDCDLVVKDAEHTEDRKGFKAIDMELLRECPCPVWLSRPIARSREDIRVAVAIDPESDEAVGRDLALNLLRLSRALADTCSGQLLVISCWDYVYEDYLRRNAWTRIPEEKLQQAVRSVQLNHRGALDALLHEAGVGDNTQILHVKGSPEDRVPVLVADKGVDILVMGTVARTGIPGFIFGNTAENLVQKVTCSLMAMKPAGFVSPVKAY